MSSNNTDPEALFSKAIELHQKNNLKDAVDLYDQILSLIPGSPLVNYNKGLALFNLNRFSESRLCYETALMSAPEEVDLLYNLALCLKKLNLLTDTVATYKKVLSIKSDDIDSMYNLGCCYKDMLEDDKAIVWYQKVININSSHSSALNNLAFVYHRSENFDEAEKCYSRLLSLQPENSSAQHILSCIRGESSSGAPLEYIEEVFDDYSERYEESLLHDLDYTGPQQMLRRFTNIFPGKSNLQAVDLGCGTGLAGSVFKTICSKIDGVDISRKMIQIASSKNVYSNLVTSDIESFLGNTAKKYNLILAADVFIYTGDLQNIFTLAQNVSLADCVFCFSVEIANNSMYSSLKSGRYAHSANYIDKICSSTGWTIVAKEECKLRKDRDSWVASMLYYVQKL